MMKLHQCCSNEKQVSGPALKVFRLHAPEIEHQIWSTLMICINYYNPVPSGLFILWMCNEDARQSATCGTKKELRRNRRAATWPARCAYFVSVWQQQISGREIKAQVGTQRNGKEEGWDTVSEAPHCGSYPGTFAASLLHTAAVMVPPGQDCVLCSVRCGNHPRTAGRNTF